MDSNNGGQTSDKPNTYKYNSWEDGATTFNLKNADTKLIASVTIPFTAKWQLVRYNTDGTDSYEVQTFN